MLLECPRYVMTPPKSGRTTQYKIEKMTDLNDDNILDENGRTINTRVYQFTRADGSKVLIQDHSTGHKFGRADGIGDQKAHFNLRPIEKPRNGNVPGAKEHYNFQE